MTANMASASTPGRMAVNMKATGTTASSTETEFTDKQTAKSAVVAGKKASVCNGTTSRLLRNEA